MKKRRQEKEKNRNEKESKKGIQHTMAPIYLRAGLSMGSIKDRYLHYEKAGN